MSLNKKDGSSSKNTGNHLLKSAPVVEEAGNFGEIEEHDEIYLANEILLDFDKRWDVCNPLTAPLLADAERIRREQFQTAREASEKRDSFQSPTTENAQGPANPSVHNDDALGYLGSAARLLNAVNRAALPFHHLIPAVPLVPTDDMREAELAVYQSRPRHSAERRQKFWQSLAAWGGSAKEAALLDDSLPCRYFESGAADRLIEVNWEVLFNDPLEGCAELYMAEMALCKRPIYEAGDDLRATLELDIELERYLPEITFAPLVGDSTGQLFRNSLTATATLTINVDENDLNDSGNGEGGASVEETAKTGRQSTAPNFFNRHVATDFSRVENWMSRYAETDERTIHRLRLGDYWLDWQRAARLARFNFDYLRTVPDARAVRFYELTKLLRAAPARLSDAGKPSSRLGISYEQFAVLMPLPLLNDRAEIERQLDALLKPLKRGGYVKSHSVEPDRSGIGRQATLLFRFGE